MPASGTSARRSHRYNLVMQEITAKKAQAQKELKELRLKNNKEDRRHRRLLKAAGKLDAPALMEIAGLKSFSINQLVGFCNEHGIDTSGYPSTSSASSTPDLTRASEVVVESMSTVPNAAPDAPEEVDAHD